MRLNPGITLAQADETLRAVEMAWQNARGGTHGYYRAYTAAVHGTYPQLKRVFAAPDLAARLHSTAYWNLLTMGDPRQGAGLITDPDVAQSHQNALLAINNAFSAEIDNQVAALALARLELTKLAALATRPGLPIVYDTNMLIAWQQPTMIKWQEVLRRQGETLRQARLVVPLRVVDELDRQKYGDGKLAQRAGVALRYLQRTLAEGQSGEATQIRDDASLEIWLDTDDRGGDADLAILRCASDLAGLYPDSGARVLTGDLGMQLRAQQMDLKVLHLSDNHRKANEELVPAK